MDECTQDGMSQCTFCMVPFGTWGGSGGRYVSATLFGCIPVFLHPDVADNEAITLTDTGHAHTPQPKLSRPFEELPDIHWDECSLSFPVSKVHSLVETLDAMPPQKVRTWL